VGILLIVMQKYALYCLCILHFSNKQDVGFIVLFAKPHISTTQFLDLDV